jgi:hypothetical protein
LVAAAPARFAKKCRSRSRVSRKGRKGVQDDDPVDLLARPLELARHLEGDDPASAQTADDVRPRGLLAAHHRNAMRGHFLDGSVGLWNVRQAQRRDAVNRKLVRHGARELQVLEDVALAIVGQEDRLGPGLA